MSSEPDGERPDSSAAADDDVGVRHLVGCVLLVGALVATVALVVWAVMRATEDSTLAALEVGAEASEAHFDLAEETVVDGWAVVDVGHPGVSPTTGNDELPHVVDYRIELESAVGPGVTLRCNPFESHVMRTMHEQNSIGSVSGRDYDGRMERCSARLPAGPWTLRARLVDVRDPAEAGIVLRRTGLRLRAR